MTEEKAGLQGLEPRSYDAIERDFQEVLQELAADKTLERFRIEYEKLFRTLRKSHDNERRLVKKCRELNSEIVSNAAKVQTALALSDEDQATIAALKKEIEKAWRMVDASHDKEAKAKETIAALKTEVASLQRLAEEGGTGLGTLEEETLQELTKQKDELIRERDSHVDAIMSLRADLADVNENLRAAEAGKAGMEADISSLQTQASEKRSEAERETRRRERLEKEVRDLKTALEAKQSELKSKQIEVQGVEETVTKLEAQMREAKSASDKVQKDYNLMCEKVQKLHQDLEAQIHTNAQLLAENSGRQVELRSKEEEITALKAEAARIIKFKETTSKKIQAIESAKAAVEAEKDALTAQVSALERDIELARSDGNQVRREVEKLAHERDVLNKLRTAAENATGRQQDLMKVSENTKKNLENEISGYRIESQRQGKQITTLERERDKYAAEVNEATVKYMQALEEVKLREVQIVEMQKKVTDGESRLRQQQALYEAVRADRNSYSKNLIEAQDEIAESKRKFKITSHQIDQLKEEVSAKDLALVKEHFEHLKVQKELDSLKLELSKAKSQIAQADEAITGQKAELQKLASIIQEADAERVRQRREYDQVLNERDILGTQLIRRNDELALLYEKLKIQQATLGKGQLAYRDRLAEIRVLKLKLADLRRELGVLRSSAANVDLLKREVATLGKALLQERTKVRALSDELEHPLNVHRWRKLEGSDPTTYEMIQKIQTLQKRLIGKTEEVVEKDMLIQEKERLYVELKTILARQPGPEVAEQLNMYQGSLREKTKQLKAMASELNMYQAQVAEYKYEMERMTQEMTDLKKRWFESKKREQVDRERQSKTVAIGKVPGSLAATTGFVGGGFALSLTQQG